MTGSSHVHFRPRLRPGRVVGTLALGPLVAGMLSVVAVAPAPAATTTQSSAVTAASVPIDRRVGTLTGRPPGLPVSGTPAARQMKSAAVVQNLVTDRVRASVELRAVPATATNAWLHVEFGRVQGGQCHGEINFVTRTSGSLAPGFSRSGARVTLDKAESEAGYQDWNCAFVALSDNANGPDTGVYDALVGTLTNVKAKPKLKIASVTMLRRPTAKGIGLVRGVWTTLEVKVRNTGRADANKVRIGGAGKGVKVRPRTVKVWAGGEANLRIQVRLVGKRRTAVRLVSRAGAVTAARRITIRPVKAPKRPLAGRYVGLKGKLKFRIRGGKIVGFRISSYTSCGGYPDFPTYSWNYYSFPNVKVPRNGIVQAQQKKPLFTVSLYLRAVRGRVTQGYFGYYGPNRCRATDAFTARRVGK